MPTVRKILLFVFLLLYFTTAGLLLPNQKVYAQTVLFEDHFDSDLSKWQATRSDISRWSIVDGMVGATVTNDIIEIVPKDGYWNQNWGNYSFELDIIPKQGIDKNVSFRFQSLDKWNEIHHTNDAYGWFRIYLERVWPGQYQQLTSVRLSETENKQIENNKLYHLKIVVNDSNIKVYITEPDLIERLIIDYDDIGTPLLYGKIGLKIGTGASQTSEVWFDNVKVTSIDIEPTPIPTIGPFELPVYYDGRLSNDPDKFKAAFWRRLTAAFDHVFARNIFRPFTGVSYSTGDCPDGTLGITCYDSHNGTDFSKRNKSIYAYSVDEGNVIFTSLHTKNSCVPNAGGFGCVVIVSYANNIFGLYAHLSKIFVVENQAVNQETLLGEIGNTGCYTCGKHLHFGVMKEIASSILSLSPMSRNEWQQLLFSLRPTTSKIYLPFCNYRAPSGRKFRFQDPSGWKGTDPDPWAETKSAGGCDTNSAYLWKFDVGLNSPIN